jgi:hypothetical protein
MPTWDSRIKQNAGATGAPRDAREGNGVGVARRALAASCWLLLLPGRRSAEAEAGDASFGAGREHEAVEKRTPRALRLQAIWVSAELDSRGADTWPPCGALHPPSDS